MHPLQPGDPERLGGYVLAGRLPAGPRGVAFLGRGPDDATLRVIKVLTGVPDADSGARFTGVRRVSSPYVARTVDSGRHDGHLYVVREHVEGRSLAETVAADGPLGADAVERVAVGVLTALTATHLAGITHRGLTPGNVIMGADGPRLTDLDLGEAAGEIGYRAPEQLRGEPCSPYADLFAWAATVVFAATGQAPFGHDADAVLTGEPALGALAEPVRGVVRAALAKDVGERPTTYTALLRLLGGREAEPEGTAKLPPVGVSSELPMYGPPSLTQADAPALTQVGLPALPPAGPHALPPGPQAPPPAGPHALPPGPQAPPSVASGAPLEGVPVQPQQSWAPSQQPWGPPAPPQQPQVWQATAEGRAAPRRRFPVALAASVTALMVLSGVGIWGAGHYAETQRIDSAAVGAKAAGENGGTAEAGKKVAGDPGADTLPQPGQPDSGGPDSGGPDSGGAQPEVAVPWAAADTEPDNVGPIVLPTEAPASVPTAPVYSTVPTPSPLSTQPVPVPQPTATQPAAQQPTSTQQAPIPQVTKTVTERPTEATPEQSQEPSPSPTQSTQAPQPPTQAPRPTPTQAPQPSTSQAPQPSKSTTPTQPEPKNTHTPVQVCGPGFSVQRSHAFTGGETFQLYNSRTKQNCVVTMKYANVGKESPVSATLDVQGGGSGTESGNFKYYAGPVKLPAAGKCVRFSGSVGAAGTGATWANCG